MTAKELEELPIAGGWTIKHGIRDGKRVSWAESNEPVVLHYKEGDYACIFDSAGRAWSVGTAPDGRRMRTEVHIFS